MIIKSGGILYLFDFDGTLFGKNKWDGLISNTRACFENGPYLNPGDFDIRWAVLTGRPKIDKPLLWYLCHSRGLHPTRILTAPTMLYSFKTEEDNFKSKVKTIKMILDGKVPMSFSVLTIGKIFYIDNDIDCVRYLNTKKENYLYQALTVSEFSNRSFNIIL